MTLNLRSVEVCRRGWLLATIALFSLVTTTVRAVNLVEEFYLPLPEPQVLQAAKAITPAVADTSFAAITAILVTGDGTQIIYDQWEDGYEGDLANPTNSTTQIWGDGIDSNGIAPGFAHDPVGLPSGTVLILSNSVPSSPRVASQYYYDGRDRIGANKALVITRAGWPSPTGPVFGGSAVVQPTIDWGTNYVSPIGQDMTDTLFRYTSFFVMASQDNTMVIIDPDGSGPLQAVTNVLNQGESWYYTGGVRRGGTINASKPVEAHIICGDTTTTYAIDWFTLYPQSDWSSSYYTPVPSVKNYSTAMYFYNNTATSISIFYTNLVATNNFVLPANGGYKFVMPTNSGSVFVSAAGEKFTTLCTVANGGTGGANDTDYNWGFTPLPKGSLTTEAFTGWAPGTSDYSGNGSPVWVTPTANTRLYVDYHGDHSGPLTDPNGNKYDTNFDLTVFQSKTIYVPGTNDQTGLRVYTIDGTLLSVVWGEDPAVAGTGNPYLDLGNPVLPFPVPRLTKSAIIVTDAPPAGLSTGDTLLYTVQVDNRGLLPLGNTVVVDAPPPALNYLTNSTTFNGQPIPDSATGTPFPLDTPGYTIPIILSGGTTIIQYKAVVVASGSIQNSAGIPGYNVNVTNTVPAAAPVPSFFVSKTILSPSTGVAGVGQTMQFNIQVINNGTAPLPNYSVTDNYPTNLSYVTATPAPNVTAGGQIVWSNLGTLANGASTNLVVSLLVNSTNFLATNTAIAASPGNTTNSGSVTFTNLAKPVAAVTVNKTLISPASGSAGIGQTIQYNLQVYNSGYATLTNLSLVDAFPRANVSYSSASVTPNIVTTNALTWTNLGSFTPGQITNITVSFLVTNYSATIVNSATAASVGGATNTGSASLSLSHSGLTVTKTVLSPTNQPVNLGSNVVFRIVIQNSGTAGITNVPLEDTYSADYFQYVSATIPPNSIARGDLLWTNLAGPGGFVAGATITNDVTFLVTGGATPAKNTAAVSYAVDVNNAAVAPASSVAAVNTAAGSISGNVYSDPDQSGTLTAGDSSLQNVNLALYTDPNGDGNPADGTLLQTVSTDANGYYELLNLSTGAFVVVQSILPGYTGTAPANNRRAVLISTLTATTNQNFFQYSVPATNYSTVAGTVWNDVNDVGFFQAGDTGLTNVQVDLIQDFNTNGVVDSGETAVQTVFTATNGTYIFTGVAPGHYVIRETDLSGYISTGDTQGTNDNQIAIALANGVATNGNDFFDFYYGLSNSNSPPVAVPDFVSTLQNVPLTIFPLANDNSPGGFSLTITNVSPTNGIASIIGGTNVLFTPVLNFTGTATIGYTITNANGKSTALITITVAPAANLSLGKTAAATVLATSNFVYTISVTNAGPSSATGVTVTDALPVGVTFVSASGSGANSGGVVTWNLGTLVSNQVTNVTVTVTAPTSGTLTNVASGGSPVGDPNPTNNTSTPITTTVTPIANLAIVKLAPATVLANSNFSYSISVTNMGPSPAPNVVVTDTLPVGVTFVTASGSGTSAGGLVTWNLGTVAALQVTNLTLTVTAPVTGVTLTNVASVSSPAVDPVPTNGVTPPVITAVTPMADLSITKTGPAANALGSNYSYTLTVSNAGPSVAANLLVTDSLPVGLTFVSSVPTTTTNASRQVIWNLSSFAIGTSNLTLTVFASQRGSLTNIASLGSPTFDPTPTNRTTPPVVIAITNRPPVAVNDSNSTPKNVAVTVPVLANDSDPDGDTLTIVSVASTNGLASISGANIIYTPTNNFLGPVTLVYTISDGFGGTNSAFIFVSVTNRPPVAVNDPANTVENVAVTVPVLANDSDPDGDTLTIISVNPTNGTALISGTNVIFTPATNFVGTAMVDYSITDNFGGTNSALITISVTNRPPVANPDNVSITENTTNTFTPLTNDVVRTPGGALTIISVSPTNGTATIIGGTNVVFVPNTNFVGTATIGYTITDGVGGTNTSLITVSVSNIPPTAGPDFVSIAENTTNTFTPLTNDVVRTPGGALSIVSVSPTNGTAAIIGGTNIVFVPATNFLGTATIGYTITDGIGGTNTSLITVSVTNRPPVANPDFTAITENTTNIFTPMTNDVVMTPGGTLKIITVNPTNGTATIIGGTNISFVPGTNFVGTATIGYTIADGIGGTNTSLITISVTNIPPAAGPDFVSIFENTTNTFAPLTNDVVRTPGGTLTIISVNPTNGTATIVGGTNVLFTPATNFVGTATIGYTIIDGIGGTNTSLITVTVSNRPPALTPDFYSVTENTTNTFAPLTNDVAVTPGGSLTIIAVAPTNGTASIVSGTNVIFIPSTNFLGTATIGYTTTDGVGGTNTALITINVTNIPPFAGPDFVNISENTTNTFTPLTNDVVRTPGGTLTIISVNPTNGTATIVGGTNVIFVPNTNFVGTATIGYTIIDGIGGTNTSLITVSVTNVPPVASPDYVSIAENTTNTFTPLTNDVVITPGGTLKIITVNPTNGTATIIGGTNVVFVPATNFLGTATIGYTITDGVGGTNTSLITISITNRPPVANPDFVSITENTTNTFTPLTNDVVVTPGGTLKIVAVNPTNGTATIVGGTNITFVPTTNFLGTATIGYTITDGVGGTNTSLITINVTNIPPVAGADFVSIAENTTNTFTPLTNDVVRTPGGTLTIISVSPTNGTASIVGGTNVLFVPTTGFLGTATVGYTIIDGIGGTNISLITISVTNRPPAPTPDFYSITENTTNTFSPLTNDAVATPDGSLTIIAVNPTNGTATIIGGTNVTFIPNTNFLGTATIGYTITDGVGGTNTSLITVSVTNIPPVAGADFVSIAENTTNTFTPLTNDVLRTSGGTLSIISVSPTNGTATIIGGTNITFVPNTNFLGTATVGYTIIDGIGGTNTSLIIISVTNRPPVANPDGYSITENTTNTFTPLTNDIVVTPGGTLTILSVSPTNGTASIVNGTNIMFIPTANFLGTATIGYAITDGIGGTNTSLETISVTNIPPIANPDTYIAVENTTNTFSPLTNDVVRTPGGTLSIISVSPTNGTASIVGGTNVLFVPTTNFLGTATIGYTIADGIGGTNTSLITITVTNLPPLASPDFYSMPENTTNTFNPLANDTLRTSGGTLSIVNISPTNGVAAIIGGTNVTFIPTNNFIGTATIGYTITDGLGGTNTSLITISVTNRPPVAGPDFVSIVENTTNTFSPLTNDVVITPGGTLTIISVNPTNGTASIVGGTNVVFVPNTNFLGIATVGYTITDGVGGTNTSLITISVTNIPPVANPDNVSITENTTNTFTPLTNDVVRTPGGSLTIISVSPTNGTATILGGTNVTFIPNTNFVGTAIIGYTIIDGIGGTNTSLITIGVTNIPPIANPDGYGIVENTTNTFIPLTNDIVRTPGGTLSIVGVNPTNGTATVLGGTNVTFVPATNFIGTATIGYTITDGIGGTNTSLITINVTNIPPVANPDTNSIAENTTNTFSPLTNDVVITPGGSLTIIAVNPTNGTATIIGGTNVTFVPTTNFLGTATIGYTITDGIGGTNTSLITINVTNIPPVANPDAYTILQNSTNTFNPLTNDVVRTPGGTLTIVSVNPTNGTAAIIGGTNVVFTPTNNFTGTATIGYTITDGIGGTNSSVITVTVLSVADIAVIKTGAAGVYAGTNFDYTITVTNLGPGVAANLSVTDTLPAAVTFFSATAGPTVNGSLVVWTNLGTLAPNASTNLTVSVIAPLTGVSLTNVASGGSPTSDPNPTNNTSPPVFTTVTPIANLAIAKIAPVAVSALNSLTYTISVTNFGPSSASSVVVTDALPAGVAFVSATGNGSNVSGVVMWNFGTLTNSQSTNVTVTVTAPASGILTNVASVHSPTLDPTPTNDVTPPVITTVALVADLRLGKTGPATVFAVSNLTYTISVTNFGPSTASSVTVTDTLPAGVTFVSAPGGVNNGGTVTWNVGTLASNQVANVTVTVTAPPSGSLTNVASGGSPIGDPNPTNNVTPPVTTSVTPVASLAIAKVGPASVLANSNFSYTISVTNFGPSSASSVVVTDALPTGATFVSASSTGTNIGGVVTWSLGTLSSNQVTNFTVTVTSPASGSLTNVASVNSPTSDPTPTNNVTPPVTTGVIPVADVSLIKVGPALVLPGTNFAYTITVTNSGPSSAANLSVTDSLPAAVTFVSATTGSAINGSQLVWNNLGTLAANSSTNLTVTVTAPLRGSITNIASAGSPTLDPTPTNNVTPPVTSTVINVPPVAVNDLSSTPVNLPVTINPLVNDFDTNGDTLTIISVSSTNGTATFTDTNVLFTPAADFLGTATVGYTISDGNGGTSSAIIFISVTNRPPVANDDVAAGTNGMAQVINPLVNDTDPDGDALTITSATSTNGIVVINGGSTSLTFTPTNNGADIINYSISDGRGGSDSAVITVNVSSVADLMIVKTAPINVLAASNFSYTISVTNLGPSRAVSVIVTDTLPAGITFVNASGNGINAGGKVTWSLGTLTALQATNLTLTVTAPVTGVSLTNVASVGSPTSDPVPTNNLTPPVVTGVTPVADVSVVKTGPAGALFGANYNYTLIVSNGGPSMAANLSVTDSLPAGLTFVTSAPLTTTNASNQVIWNVGNLNANTASNLTLTVIATQRGSLTNTAAVGGPTFDPIPTNNLTPPVVTGVTNNPPLANPDLQAMTENTSGTFSPLTNDVVRTPGGVLTLLDVSTTNGTVSVLNSTNITFTPATNFIGLTTLIYTITDSVGGTNSSTFTVLVTNIPPLAIPDAYSMKEDGTNTSNPLLNDVVQTAGGTLSIVSVSPTNGTATIIGGTNVVFIPIINFVGVTTIGYTITDNVGGTNTSLITVTVTNQSPIAIPQTFSTTENTALPVTLAGVDPVGRPLSFIITGNPAHGILTGLNTNTGAVTYTPTNNFLGTDTFTFRVNNGVNNSSNATITINVTPIADLLVQQSGPVSGIAGSDLVFTVAVTNLGPAGATNVVITNDIDASFTFVSASGSGVNSGGVVTWTIPVLPANGKTNLTVTLVAVEGGTYTNVASGFNDTPDLNTSNNDGSLTNAQVVTTVSALADVQVFKTGSANVLAGGTASYAIIATNAGPSTAANVVVQDRLPVGASLQTASGDYVISNNVVVWSPTSLPGGSTTNFTVTLTAPFTGTLTNRALSTSDTPDSNTNNNNGSSSNSVVRTVVTPVADLAVGKSGAAAGVLGANFSYTITVTNFGPSSAANFSVTDSLPAGIVFISSVPVTTTNAASQVIWTNLGTLAANATTNLTLTVKAVARGVVTNIATVGGPTLDPTPTNNVSVPVVTGITNRPPLAVDDFGSTAENVAVTIPALANDSDPDGDALTIISVSPTNGTANIVGTNIVFTPTGSFLGTGYISYTISDGFGGTDTGLITINVTNRPPVAVNDSGSTPKNVAVTIPVLANDSDPDGDSLTIVSVSPTNGLATISGTNVVFTPTNNFLGTAIIGYTITDGFGGYSTALIFVAVTNRAPLAANDFGSTPKNVAITIPAMTNDSDPDGDTLTIISVSPTNGLASISGTNVIFTPTNNFLGTAIIGYRIIDGFGGTNSALIFVTVTNRAPVAQNDSVTTPKNVAVTVPVLANDSDPDGDTLTIISVSPTNGLATISGTNVIFTPTNNFLGTTYVGYTIRDNFGGTNSALITILVTNRAPVAVNDTAGTPKNVAVTIPALANDSDPDGDTLTIISVSPTNGLAVISGTNVVFTPTNSFIGTATVGYTIIDGFGGTNSALITINVTNRPPVANSQGLATTFNTPKAITLTGSDADGDPLTYIVVGQPSNGTLSLLDTNAGTVTYTPANNFTGTDTFTFRVNDGTTNSALATVTITVGTPIIADLAVFKVGPTNAVAGSNLVYTITVTNIGPSTATNVLVSDHLPPGFAFISATPNGVVMASNVVNWTAFNLPAHAKTNFTVSAISMEGGTYTNFATAISDAFDPNPTNSDGSSTNSQVRTVVSALADVVVFKTGGTNVAAGGVVNYTITTTNMGPSSATNVVVKDNLPPGSTFQSASGSFTVSNNVVTWTATFLTNGASAVYTIALTAPAGNAFTNIALATSTTPDPNPTNNSGAANKSRVSTTVVPAADLVVLVFGPTNAVVGSNFVYSLILSNAGPSVASNNVVSDTLPTNLVFVSASSGGAFSNGTVTWPLVKSLAVGGITNYSITVYSPLVGIFTNVASAISATLDPNPTNNTGVLPASQVQTTVTFAQFSFIAGTPVFNPQTGLYEETVIVTNVGNGTVAGFQLYVTLLTSNVFLWNATGTNASGTYVQYNSPVDPSNHVSLALEFYDPARVAFTNTLRVVPIIPGTGGTVGTNGSVAIDKIFTDTRTNGTRFVIEFVSVPGKTYTIIYSADLVTWKVATPSVTANANVTQWYDDGPPKTESLPTSVGSRFYRVIQN